MEEQPAIKARSGGKLKFEWIRNPLVIVGVLLLVALAWNWYDTRVQIGSLREEIARRLRDVDTDSRDARLVARQVQESEREAQTRLTQLEAKLAESQNQQVALEALYQELSRSRDEWVLAEVEQILVIAEQQLQLAGNVQAALLALQTADSRLARSDRPQFTPLRKVLAKDIERLKATSTLDIPGLAFKLDQVMSQVDGLPLAEEARATASSGARSARIEQGFWSRFGAEVWGELKQLVRVQNVERPESALLAPSQSFFLRENLKLRLLDARLALLQRDEETFRDDLKAVQSWIGRYFDLRAKPTVAALAALKPLAASTISMQLPSIADSLSAVRNYKLTREKASR